MTRIRFALGATFLLIAAPAMFGACGGDEPSSDPKLRYCEQLCACNKCSEDESGTCKDDIINLEDEAKDKDCKSEFESYVTCLVGDAACTDGEYDESVCVAEDKDLNGCLHPVPACKTVKDGVCNEPAPKGDGTCAEGTDADDCMAPPMCTTAGDGYCDEPGGNGTGLCEQGTDTVDCKCPYAGDGYCDEPENGGTCVEGSDPLDCMAPACVTCAQYLETQSGTLCTTSQTKYQTLFTCACTVSCTTYCDTGVDFCDQYPSNTQCTSCMSTSCSTAYTACLNDTGI
ncbi:hypothetical protein [Polyangium aurulentum]|uniref:hypothetical protein n=1 Tax=Polyangium aurulentum TaxID=2567896 RepID=UPI0010AE60C4|nr:hypothetical protein [Polyangium aurulentum]UQA58133.1 hypothetical protein E8A73_043925 [Polyangium aurulentum]